MRLTALALAAAAALAAPPKLILFIMVDDLGWADVGWHRTDNATENATPHMDALVAEGVALNSHYVYRMCTPSRTSALSGRLPVHVNDRLQNPEERACRRWWWWWDM
jgi:arylsulfatase I/J